MTVPKANQRAVNKYIASHYDRINVTFPKGQKEVIQAHAGTRGESVNGFIIRAVSETIEREKMHQGAAEETDGGETAQGAAE